MVMEMMEKMMSDPESQKMMYPYLPEHMRNPETFKWMMENPEMKEQITGMLEQQMGEMDPALMDQMGGFDMNSPEVQQQFEQLGMKPDEFVSKIWSDPDLMQGMSNPKVQAALADIQANPANAFKHMSDPDVSKVIMRMNEMFSPQMMAAAQQQQQGQ